MTDRKILCVCLRSNAAYNAAVSAGVPFKRFYVFHKDAKSAISKIFVSALAWSAVQRINDGQHSSANVAYRIIKTLDAFMSKQIPDSFLGLKTNPEDYILVSPLQFYKHITKTDAGEEVNWRMHYLSVKPDRITVEAWLQKAQILYHGKWETACARCPKLWERMSTNKPCNMTTGKCQRHLARPTRPREESQSV